MSPARRMLVLGVGVLLSLSSTAVAMEDEGPAVVLTRFRGVGAKAAQRQLAGALCQQLRCLPPSRSAARRDEADALVFGRLVRAKSGHLSLKLSVMDTETDRLKTVRLPLDRSKRLRRSGLRTAKRIVLKATAARRRAIEAAAEEEAVATSGDEEEESEEVDGEGSAPETPEADTPSSAAIAGRASAPARSSTLAMASPDSESPDAFADERPVSREGAAPGHPVAEAERSVGQEPSLVSEGRPWLVLQVDGQVTAREARFEGTSGAGAESPSADRILAPMVHLQLFPRGLGGFGVDGRFSQTIGRSATLRSSGAASLSVAMQEALVGWRFGTTTSSYVKPQVGLRRHAATLQRAEGSGFLDAPGVDYRGWTAGVAMGWTMLPSWRLEGRAAYLGIVSSGELISDSFFKSGRSHGGEATLGLAVGLFGSTELVGSVNLALYQHQFDTEPGQLYVATGGTDRFLSASMGLRTAL